MVTFSNNVEPANGFLVRYLHRKLMESEHESSLTNDDLIRVLDWVPKLWYHLHTFLEKHSTSDFLIGMEPTGQETGLLMLKQLTLVNLTIKVKREYFQ